MTGNRIEPNDNERQSGTVTGNALHQRPDSTETTPERVDKRANTRKRQERYRSRRSTDGWIRREFWLPKACEAEARRAIKRIIRAYEANSQPPEQTVDKQVVIPQESRQPSQLRKSSASSQQIGMVPEIISTLAEWASVRSFTSERAARRAIRKQAFSEFRKAGLADAFTQEWPSIARRLGVKAQS